MHRPGAQPDEMQAQDFLCDFCGACWSEDRPMVEGHKGSLICGRCLTLACACVLVRNEGISLPPHASCAMCLLNKSGDYWQSPMLVTLSAGDVSVDPTPGAAICRWCIERSATMLAKDAASAWTRPA